MKPVHFIVPGEIKTRTGGFIYDRRIVAELIAQGFSVEVHELPPGWPVPDDYALAAAAQVLAAIPDDSLVIVDGLALGVLPEEAATHAQRLRLIALVHHPLAEETGLSREERDDFAYSERAALAQVRHVIATSGFTADALLDYGVDRHKISVVLPGVDRVPLAMGAGRRETAMLCVATLTPRKAHDVLLNALSQLGNRPWRLHLVGSELRHPRHALGIRQLCDRLQLGSRVTFHGELGGRELDRVYHRSDLFVLASHYEGYGMVITEAVARGLPVVTTAGGALGHTLPNGAGLLAPPGDVAALRDVLRRVLDEPGLLDRLRQGAIAARERLPTWSQTAQNCARLLESLAR